jgi:acid phosphatase class B
MKKLFFAIICLCVSFAFVACSGSSPSGEAAKCIDYLKDKDYAAFVETINVKADTPEKEAATKQQLLEMLQGKGDKMYEKKGGIASYSLISEQIAEDGQIAKVEYEIVYGDGSKDNNSFKMVLVDGVWKQDISK